MFSCTQGACSSMCCRMKTTPPLCALLKGYRLRLPFIFLSCKEGKEREKEKMRRKVLSTFSTTCRSGECAGVLTIISNNTSKILQFHIAAVNTNGTTAKPSWWEGGRSEGEGAARHQEEGWPARQYQVRGSPLFIYNISSLSPRLT